MNAYSVTQMFKDAGVSAEQAARDFQAMAMAMRGETYPNPAKRAAIIELAEWLEEDPERLAKELGHAGLEPREADELEK